jgi:lactoylglutathione lyase
MVTRVDHIDLRVADVEASVAFFKRLGFVEVRRTEPPRHSVEVALPGSDQVVFEVRPAGEGKTGINHVAFKIEGADSLEQLKAAGITFNRESNYVPDTGRTVSNFRDSDGTSWQLTD